MKEQLYYRVKKANQTDLEDYITQFELSMKTPFWLIMLGFIFQNYEGDNVMA